MLRGKAAATAILTMTATAAVQATPPMIQPIQYGREILRYAQGQPTLDVRGRNGIVQISPLPLDHGCLTFGVVVFNTSNRASDFGPSGVTVTIGDQPGVVLTARQLQHRAGNRAFWTSIAIAAVAGVAAGVASANNSHYTARTYTPRGTYVTKARYRSGASAVDSAIIAGSGAAAIGSVQARLDATRAEIGEDVLQLTTVEPGDSYGGRVVIDKFEGTLPQTISLTVSWNGESYTTRWQVAPQGTPAPPFVSAPAAADMDGAPPATAITPAVLRVEHDVIEPREAVIKVVARRPKHYPQDDTVEVPM